MVLNVARKDISGKQVVECALAYRKRSDHKFIDELLQELTGQPQKVCYSAMKRAENRGYIDCGVSLRTGWATHKGFKLSD